MCFHEAVGSRPSDTGLAGGVGQASRRPPFAAVVPVFNPEPPLVSLCERLVEAFPLVVVVDDGSVEHQESFAALPPAVVLLRHEANRGKGAAMKTALRFLLESGRPDIHGVVFVDGDGQHAVDDILAVAARAERSGKVVFGVRDFSRRRVPFRSWWGNRWTSWEVRLLFRFRVGDTQTGLRAVPGRLFESLVRLRGERFEFEAAWFPLLRTLNEEILTVPISTIYLNSNRASHFRPLRDTLLTQRALFRRTMA